MTNQPINLNQDVLKVMVFGKESERIVCPSCGKKKEVAHKCCADCRAKPGMLRAIGRALDDLKRPELRRSIKVELNQRKLIDMAIGLLRQGALPASLPEVLIRLERINPSQREEVESIVKNARTAIEIAPKIRTFAAEKGLNFRDHGQVVERFVRDRRAAFLPVKAAVYCVIIPDLEREKKDGLRQEMFDYAMSELEQIGQREKRLALQSTPEQIAESLVERFSRNPDSPGSFGDFCLRLAGKVQRAFRNLHKEEWDKLVSEQVDRARGALAAKFHGRRVA